MKNFYLLIALVFAAYSTNAQTILSEDFEGGLPSGWTQTTLSTDGGWLAGDETTLASTDWGIGGNGSNFVASNDDGCNCDKSADYFISPAMDLSSGAALLSFDMIFAGGSYQGATEVLTIVSSEDGGATWTTVEEIVGTGSLDWVSTTVNLTGLSGASTNLAFFYNDGSGWTFGAAIDNVNIFIPLPDNAALTSISTGTTQETGASVDIAGTITNLGSNPITAMDITWNGNTENLTGLNIAPLATYDFTHSMQFTVVNGSTTIDVSVDAVNGGADTDASDNSASIDVSGVAFIPTKRIVFEEATGTWCGWCPRGHVFMEYMEDNYDDFLGVAVHNSDPMANTVYDSGFAALIGGYPSGAADRNPAYADTDPSNFEAVYLALQSEIAPAELTVNQAMVTFDEVTRELVVPVSAEFVKALNGDYRFGMIMTENEVTGTTSGYDQVNYYSNETNDIALDGAGHDWQAEPAAVPAADMVYDHVGRMNVGGFTGMAGSLPTTIAPGDVLSYTFTYTIPAEWEASNMHFIVVLQDNENSSTGQILNGVGGAVPESVANNNLLAENIVSVFPNPASDVSYVRVDLEETADVSISIFNNLGQAVYNRELSQLTGDMVVPVNSSNFASGIYHVNVTIDGKFMTKKLVIKK
jgi:hypothetical protein